MPDIDAEEARFRVNWLEHQPHRCYFYPGRDCPGWHERQPCDPMCQRLERPVPTGVEPVNPDGASMPKVTGMLLECDNCGDSEFHVYYDEDVSRYRLECSTCLYEHFVRAGA